MANPINMIIYDRSNYDSLVCAAIIKYNILHDPKNNFEIVAYNWDEIPITTNTTTKTVKSKYYTISLCATIIDPTIIGIIYNSIYERFASIQFNPKYKDIIEKVHSCIFQLFTQRQYHSQLHEEVIHNVGQSASLTLYNYLYRNNDTSEKTPLPLFYKYLDALVTDSYYDYESQIDRTDVIMFEKGLEENFHNDFDTLYEELFEENGPTDIDDYKTIIIKNDGAEKFNNINNYIIDYYKKYGGIVWEGNEKGGILRRVLPLFTCEKLSTDILTNPIFEQNYDSIVTFNQLKTGKWEMRLYNIIHPIEIENPNNPDSYKNLTIEQLRTIRLNTFSAGIYVKEMYNGMGNDIYGWAIISNATFSRMLSLRKI